MTEQQYSDPASVECSSSSPFFHLLLRDSTGLWTTRGHAQARRRCPEPRVPEMQTYRRFQCSGWKRSPCIFHCKRDDLCFQPGVAVVGSSADVGFVRIILPMLRRAPLRHSPQTLASHPLHWLRRLLSLARRRRRRERTPGLVRRLGRGTCPGS